MFPDMRPYESMSVVSNLIWRVVNTSVRPPTCVDCLNRYHLRDNNLFVDASISGFRFQW